MTLGMPSLGLGLMGAGAGFIGAPIALVIGAATCASINLGMLGTRRELRAKDLGALPSNEGPPTNDGTPRPIVAASAQRPPAEATAR